MINDNQLLRGSELIHISDRLKMAKITKPLANTEVKQAKAKKVSVR